jgi:hypothetical protein
MALLEHSRYTQLLDSYNQMMTNFNTSGNYQLYRTILKTVLVVIEASLERPSCIHFK